MAFCKNGFLTAWIVVQMEPNRNTRLPRLFRRGSTSYHMTEDVGAMTRSKPLGKTASATATALVILAVAQLAASADRVARAADNAVLRQDDAPVHWLSPAGKSDSWIQSTKRCRELLEQLDLRSPLVQSHLDAVKQKAAMLLHTPSFDWKRKTAVEYLENLLSDLLAGREPSRRYAGKGFGYAYWSETMQRIEAIWVHVPPAYDPARQHQLFMYYKCGGGIHFKDGRVEGGYRPTVDMANRSDTFHAWSSLSTQVKGRMGAHIELAEATAALAKDFSVDLDRVFLTGWSDGGFTAIWLGARYPHLVAGIVPNCANWQYTNVEVPCLANLPTLVVDGWGDGGYNKSQFVRWQTLTSLGVDTSAVWGQHGHSYQPYEDEEEFLYLLDWARSKRRNLYPKRVRYATWNLAWPRAYWVSIDRVESPWLACSIDAAVTDNNRIDVATRNVAAYKLLLCEQIVDSTKTIEVRTNGELSYRGRFQPEMVIELAEPPEGKYTKSADMPDGIATQTVGSSYNTDGYLTIPGRTWLSVKPTGLGKKEAALLESWYPRNAKADTEITAEDLAEHNLFIYGGPRVNRLAARIAADLPVQFESGRFAIGDRVYDQPSHCVALLHPNSLNPKKYIILYAYNDAAAFARGNFFEMTGERVWAFRTGDCVVRGIPVARPKWGVAVSDRQFGERHVIFDNAWRTPSSDALGEIIRPLDYVQLLRLQADAIREATETDIGIIAAHTPRYLRWSDHLPAGPVTLHDLATLDALPQYISIGTMQGDDLVGKHPFRPAAWTVRSDRRERAPGADELTLADIDPTKTYRVAIGHHGVPAYRAEPAKMPHLFKFTSPEDFLRDPHNAVLVGNLTMTPIQVTEAVARYIRKRGKVAPRPTHYDLTDYIMNPQVNQFGSCDWLHVAVEADWLDGAGTSKLNRYMVNFGLRRTEDPELAAPRANSKQFREFDPKRMAPACWSLEELDRHLPVIVTAKADSRCVLADDDYRSFSLGRSDSPGNRVGRAVVLSLHIANNGDRDLTGQLVLADTVLRKVNGEVWPTPAKDSVSHYAGYHRAVGKWKEPPVHEDAVVLLFPAKAPNPEKLVAPGAGYNFGLAGLGFPVDVGPGQKVCSPLLLISIDQPAGAPAISLAAVLESIRGKVTSAGLN